MTLQEAWPIWRDRHRGFYFPDRIALAREVLVLNGAPVDELRCPGCRLRVEHQVDGDDCREMQYEREWKNREDRHDDEVLDMLA